MQATTKAKDHEVACNDKRTVRRIASRLNKGDLMSLFLDWGLVPAAPPVWPSRAALIDLLVNSHLKNEVTYQQYAGLLLRKLHGKTKSGSAPKWEAMRIAGSREALTMDVSCSALQDMLSKELSVFFSNYVHVEQAADGDVWIFVGIYESVEVPRCVPPRSQTLYIMWRPHTEFLFASQFKVAYRDYILQALMHAFSAEGLEKLPVASTHLDTVIQFALDAPSLGTYAVHAKDVANPLSLQRTRMTAQPVQPGAPVPAAVVEDEPARQKRRDLADAVMGPQDAPHAEHVVFNVECGWDTSALPSGMTSGPALAFKARCTLDGDSVLNGLKDMIPAGIMAAPLQPFYVDMLAEARTTFTLSDANLNLHALQPPAEDAARAAARTRRGPPSSTDPHQALSPEPFVPTRDATPLGEAQRPAHPSSALSSSVPTSPMST